MGTRTTDISECDVCYYDSEEYHWDDYAYNFDELYAYFSEIPRNCIGPFSPFYTKAAIMWNFANKLFPGKFSVHPMCFNLPEKKEELIDYMRLHPECHFIAKPDDGVCGKNILMLHSV